jgi:cytochrome c oxidase accessory protein FixG
VNDPVGVTPVDVEAVNARRSRPPLYAARKSIHPMRVSGLFRRLKWRLMAAMLAIYYLTPWIRWDRGEGIPDQAVLVDLAHRRFFFFFIEIWPQEFYYVAGMLIMAGIGLFLETSVLGRAWCGYACPQTIWVDLYVHMERWIDGDRNARFRLEKAPWTASKIAKRVAKYSTWFAIAVATGGAWVFYFADAPTLFIDLVTGQAASIAYATIGVLTATTFVFGGFMREQVCTYMCPWPRIQGAMLDENSLTVTYHDWRGEPRRKGKKAAEGAPAGDCINCNLCVAVCPMGIDIRDGSQLECITCALCIDACNNVMARTGGAPDLISYSSLDQYEALADGKEPTPLKRSIFRPRTLIYAALWAAAGLGMLAMLATRDLLDVNVLHDRNPQYVRLADGSIRNGYVIKLLNMEQQKRRVLLVISELPGALMTVAGDDLWPSRTREYELAADKVLSLHVFITVPADQATPGATPFRLGVSDLEGLEQANYGATFYVPEAR